MSGLALTTRGKFFEKEDYLQLINIALQGHYAPIKTQRPAIMKPKELWSGKQVVSTILENLIPFSNARPSFTFKTSVKKDIWIKSSKDLENKACVHQDLTDSQFVMRDGELMCGVLDKSSIGSTSRGLIHVCFDVSSW